MDLNSIITLNISRQTTAVAKAGFGVPMVLGTHNVFTERLRFYSDSASVLTDGFESTDSEYLAVAKAFSQSPPPVKVAIGRIQADDVGISVDTVANITLYTVTIDGTIDFEYTSDASATDLEIAAGLVLLIDAHADYTATDDVDGTFSVSNAVNGTAFSVAVDSNMSVEKPITKSETITDALNAILLYNTDWFGFVNTDRLIADALLSAAWAEANGRLFGHCDNTPAIYDSGSTTDILAQLKALNYDNSFFIFNAAPNDFLDFAWMAGQFTTDPGSTTWKFKTPKGIASDSLTVTQSSAIADKNGNTFEHVAGVDITSEGVMVGGEYIDVIRGSFWLKARMQERLYAKFVNLPKIPHTDAGYAIIEAEIRAQINEAIVNGYLVITDLVITIPLADEVSDADKASRTLTGVSWSAKLSGAVHKLVIGGTITL